MTFGETLSAVHAMLGHRVEVVVGAAHGLPAVAGSWSGTLAAATELPPSHASESGERLFFYFTEDTGAGFFLDPEAFVSAERRPDVDADREVLEICSGPLRLIVDAQIGAAA